MGNLEFRCETCEVHRDIEELVEMEDAAAWKVWYECPVCRTDELTVVEQE